MLLPTYRLTKTLKKHQQGHCPACGYDIRANPAKCSECGLEIVDAVRG